MSLALDEWTMFGLKYQAVMFSALVDEIALDIPMTFTYHTRALATGLTAGQGIYYGNWLSRGADSHDE